MTYPVIESALPTGGLHINRTEDASTIVALRSSGAAGPERPAAVRGWELGPLGRTVDARAVANSNKSGKVQTRSHPNYYKAFRRRRSLHVGARASTQTAQAGDHFTQISR
jgi:hypothetical protein